MSVWSPAASGVCIRARRERIEGRGACPGASPRCPVETKCKEEENEYEQQKDLDLRSPSPLIRPIRLSSNSRARRSN